MRRGIVLVGATAIAAIGTGIALGGIPGSGGAISACYDKQSGQLRIYDAEPRAGTSAVPKGCGSKEQAISWNQAGLEGPEGPRGLQGEPGPQGEDGADGAPGVSNWRIVELQGVALAGEPGEHTALCREGEAVLGGGFEFTAIASSDTMRAISSKPIVDDGKSGWRVMVDNTSGQFGHNFSVYSICATVN